MVGREQELRRLRACLDDAAAGRGRAVTISGEAGIGKTRLVEELAGIARSRGFHVLSSHSLYESLTPYMPFVEALRSGGLEPLFAEEAPRVEALYLVSRNGLLVKAAVRERVELDPDIFASMLTAVGNFVRESLAMLGKPVGEGALNTLGYEDYRILVETGKDCDLVAVITGREDEFLISDMRAALRDVERDFGGVLERWDGQECRVEGTEAILRDLIGSGKYDGVPYGRDDPKARRSLLFENVSLGLTRHVRGTPTVLCLEDLQWADPSTLALMHYVARNVCRHGLLLLGTYRPEDVSAAEGRGRPLLDFLQLMDREGLCEKIELQRLPPDAMPDFLTSMLGKGEFEPRFREWMYEETEGNPLFMVQLLKLLLEEKVIGRVEGRWKPFRDFGDVSIPSQVYGVITRRLDRVEPEDRRILDFASVVGERFGSGLLADAMGMDRVRLLERLRALERSHRLVHPTDGQFRFDHTEIARVLYDEIPRELRMEYHAAVAEAIERSRRDDVDGTLGDLAFHYHRSRNREKALTYLTRAAEKAKKGYSNDEAIRFYTEALESEDDPRKRAGLLESLGEVHELKGDFERAVASYERALGSAESPARRAEVKARIGRVYRRTGRYDGSIEACEEALRLVEGTGTREEAFALHNIGALHTVRGDYDRALECQDRCLRIQEGIGDRKGVAESLNNIGVVEWRRGNYDRALEQFERSLRTWQEVGDLQGVASSLNNIGVVSQERGDYGQALDCYERSLRIKENIGDLQGVASSLNNIGVVHQERGDHEKALECHDRSLRIKEKIGDRQGVASSLHNIGVVHKDRGDYDEALGYYRKSLELRERIGDQQGIAESLSRIAEAALGKGDLETALDFCHRAQGLAARIGLREIVARSKRIAGVLHAERREWAESTEDFQESIRISEGLAQGKDLGETCYQFGLMWKAKGDAEAARAQLGRAAEVFERMKLEGKAGEARAALRAMDEGATRG